MRDPVMPVTPAADVYHGGQYVNTSANTSEAAKTPKETYLFSGSPWLILLLLLLLLLPRLLLRQNKKVS